jgi:hypothetical protein
MTDHMNPRIASGQPDLSKQTITDDGRNVTLSRQPDLPVHQVLTAIMAAATNESVDPGKLRELLSFHKELMAVQAEQQFTEAFQRLSRDLPRIKKNGSVEYKGKEAFRFATFDNISAVIRPLLEREGFTLSFDTEPRNGEGGGAIVTGRLSHVAGHHRTASIALALDASGGKNNIQGMGSTFSYGRRYCTTMLLNLTTEDDDDGKAGGTKFITEEQADELRAMAKNAKREEGPLLDKQFGGTVRSFEEIEIGQGYFAIKSTLHALIQQQAKKATS